MHDWLEAKAEVVSVDNPSKEMGHTIYCVTHADANNTVIRRYSDFCELRRSLIAQFPGAYIPPLPEKKAVGRFKEDFVAKRMRGLQYFLEEILKSPDFQCLNYVVAFLECPDVSESQLLAKEQPEPVSVGWMTKKMNNVSVSKSTLEQYDEIVQNKEIIQRLKDYISDMSQKHKRAFAASTNFLRALRRFEELTKNRSLSYQLCQDVDIEFSPILARGNVGSDYAHLDKTFSRASDTEATAAIKIDGLISDLSHLLIEPLERYLKGFKSLRTALQCQDILKKDYVAKDQALKKRKASDDDVDKAHVAYTMGMERLVRDFDRHRMSHGAELCSMLLSVCCAQIRYHEDVNLEWESFYSSMQEQLTTRLSEDGNDKSIPTSPRCNRRNVHSQKFSHNEVYSEGMNDAMLSELSLENEDENSISV